MRQASFVLAVLLASPRQGVLAQTPYRPDKQAIAASYARADRIRTAAPTLVKNLTLTPHWGDGRMWFVQWEPRRERAFRTVDTKTGKVRDAFDHERLAVALSTVSGKSVSSGSLPFPSIDLADNGETVTFRAFDKGWTCSLKDYAVTAAPVTLAAPRNRQRGPSGRSPNGEYSVVLSGGKVIVNDAAGNKVMESASGDLVGPSWSPDSRFVAAFRVLKGDRKEVYLIESSPSGGGRAKLTSRPYDLPGDQIDRYELVFLELASKKEIPSDLPPMVTSGAPWNDPPSNRWWADSRGLVVDHVVRGYQQYKVHEVEPSTGRSKVLVDERSPTFVDVSNISLRLLERSKRLLWRSERDGWGHLYVIAPDGSVERQLTRGPWVVKDIIKVDEAAGQVWFTACGKDTNPYWLHLYKIGLDGSGLTDLTPESGDHAIAWSPDRSGFVDTVSRVDGPPSFVFRDADGKTSSDLGSCDASGLKSLRFRQPEPFVAKGRDGKTDIWGIVCRPSDFDPKKKYPVIENLYAGPHDSFVPRRFTPVTRMQQLAELGFIVVQIDGMGTNNRGKAFHDVCYKNLADAGFPDRIQWMKALASKDKSVDLDRVGVYGTSAGGQESTAALLFHPEFYKVGVSSCGCHDNRMDKVWWNEQWMGYPVGPHYEEQSNLTNAKNLRGKLLLMVGELDRNVPPESTLRLVDALIKAKKEFDFLILPGMDHTDGGPYGERKRRDFFVRHLLGVEPPDWNTASD
ncbi:MAG: S9 family peptidase [Armatimonadetes bacterium]|nr:S9 family peptidase [Armatimonadota bacterium]